MQSISFSDRSPDDGKKGERERSKRDLKAKRRIMAKRLSSKKSENVEGDVKTILIPKGGGSQSQESLTLPSFPPFIPSEVELRILEEESCGKNVSMMRSNSDKDLREFVNSRPTLSPRSADKYSTIGARSNKARRSHPINNLFELSLPKTKEKRGRQGSAEREIRAISAILTHVKNFAPNEYVLKSNEEIFALKEAIASELLREMNQNVVSEQARRSKSQNRSKSKRPTFSKATGLKAEKFIHITNIRNTLSPDILQNLLSLLKVTHQLAYYYRKPSKKHKNEAKDKQLYSLFVEHVGNFVHSLLAVERVTTDDFVDKEKYFEELALQIQSGLNRETIKGVPMVHSKIFERAPFALTTKDIFDAVLDQASYLFYYTSCILTFLGLGDENDFCYAVMVLAMLGQLREVVQLMCDLVETFYSLKTKYEHQHSKTIHKPSSRSIWQSNDLTLNGDKDNGDDIYRPGSFNNLVARLCSQVDRNFVTTFFNASSSFCSPYQLWDKLTQHYNVPGTVNQGTATEIKRQTASVITQWLKRDAHLLDVGLIESIAHFSETSIKLDFPALNAVITKVIEERKDRLSLDRTGYLNYIPIHKLQDYDLTHFLLSYDPMEIAEQLTLIDWEIYSKISLEELLGQTWYNSDAKSIFSRHVVGLMQRNSKIHLWVATTVLLQERSADRVEMLKHLIAVAQYLENLKNYHTLFGMLGGLNSTNISKTRRLLPKKSIETLNYLALLQDPSSSFKYLRSLIRDGAMLPFVGLFLSELTQIDGGNPDHFKTGVEKVINFPKYEMATKTISLLLEYQQGECHIQNQEPLYTFLQTLPALWEKELNLLSMDRDKDTTD